jgi:hypothetical protein
MKLRKSLSAALFLSTLATALTAQAGVLNGDFNAGLNGWSSLGDVAVSSGAAVLTTASLDADDTPAANAAFNMSGNAAALIGMPGGLEDFAGLPLGALDPDPAAGTWAFEGSALGQTLTVQAGDRLSFDWTFTSNEDPLTGMNDYAFVLIGDVLTVLGDVAGGATGQHFSYAFSSAGNVKLVFGVVDINDYVGTSRLGIDAVRVEASQSVPEPGTLALGLGGLLVGAARLRSRQH